MRGSEPPTITPAILRGIALFADLEDHALEGIADVLPCERYEVGKTIIREGDEDRELFVVVSGELEVFKQRDGGDLRVALLGPGDWFGDMSMVDPQPRSASVRATAPTLALRMSATLLDETLYENDVQTYALLMRNLAKELSRRLRVADGILSNMVVNVADAYR